MLLSTASRTRVSIPRSQRVYLYSMEGSEMVRSNQSLIISRIAVWVPSKQQDGAFDRFESYPAALHLPRLGTSSRVQPSSSQFNGWYLPVPLCVVRIESST